MKKKLHAFEARMATRVEKLRDHPVRHALIFGLILWFTPLVSDWPIFAAVVWFTLRRPKPKPVSGS